MRQPSPPDRRRRAAKKPARGAIHALFLLSGLLAGIGAAPVALAEDLPPASAPARDPYAGFVTEAAQRFGIPEAWIRAVASVESGGDPRAVSPAGAMGLMQIMPDTWAGLRRRYGLGADPFAPRDNILAGAAYLREMWGRYGNTAAMLAAYNAGPARYEDHLRTGRNLPAETRAYVALLAPMLGGEAIPLGGTPARARTADWREASLFVTAGTLSGGETADRPKPEGQASAQIDLAPDARLAGGIFVARQPAGGAP